MGARELEERGNHSPAELVVAFAVRPALVVVEPARELLREARFELGARKPLPRADVDLAQRLDGDRLEATGRGDGLGCLERASERARVHGREVHRRELGGEPGRLRATEVVERRGGGALEGGPAVPAGLSRAGTAA